jgi:hypothetical protein
LHCPQKVAIRSSLLIVLACLRGALKVPLSYVIRALV